MSVNKAAKEYLRGKFQSWHASQVNIQLVAGNSNDMVDLALSIIKPLVHSGCVNCMTTYQNYL